MTLDSTQPVAFAQLVASRVARLRARALKLCRHAADAEDLVQDTVVRALRFEHTFRVGTNLDAWLNSIETSVFISGRRRQARERRGLELLTSSSEISHDIPGTDELSRSVQAAFSMLPERFVQTVTLVDVHGMAYRDAAERLGVPVGTVMSRLHRARRLLAARLRDGDVGDKLSCAA